MSNPLPRLPRHAHGSAQPAPAVIAAPCAFVLLSITIILIPAAILAAIALAGALIFGWIALGYETGKRLTNAFHWQWHPAFSAGLGTFLLTLVVNSAQILNFIPGLKCLTWILPTLVGLFALGAVIMTRFDIYKADTVSKMWQFSGMNPGMIRGKIKDGEETVTTEDLLQGDRKTKGNLCPFNAFLKSKLLGVLGPSFASATSTAAVLSIEGARVFTLRGIEPGAAIFDVESNAAMSAEGAQASGMDLRLTGGGPGSARFDSKQGLFERITMDMNIEMQMNLPPEAAQAEGAAAGPVLMNMSMKGPVEITMSRVGG